MINALSVVLAISSSIANFHVPLYDTNLTLPVTGSATFTAKSAAGTAEIEDVEMTVVIDGVTVANAIPITEFPIDVPGVLGTVLTELVKYLDATIELTITSEPPVVTAPVAPIV